MRWALGCARAGAYAHGARASAAVLADAITAASVHVLAQLRSSSPSKHAAACFPGLHGT